jgi:hypothetical protein
LKREEKKRSMGEEEIFIPIRARGEEALVSISQSGRCLSLAAWGGPNISSAFLNWQFTQLQRWRGTCDRGWQNDGRDCLNGKLGLHHHTGMMLHTENGLFTKKQYAKFTTKYQ